MSFRFTGEKVHLTYKTHVDMAAIKTLMKALRPTKMYSIVHENGDTDESNATPYAHTHVFWWWHKRMDTVNQRVFDVDGIHPHIQGNKGIKWAKGIVMNYHVGNKTKVDGKKYYIEPVKLEQWGIDEWNFESEMFAQIMAAPSLEAACMAVDILPKSVGDVKTLRAEKRRKVIKPRLYYGPYMFNPTWDSDEKTLVVVGEPGVGKTQWARWYCASEGYFYCKNRLDCMRHYNGEPWIIFDDINVEDYTNVDLQGVFDVENGGSVNARYAPIDFPENVKRIWLRNPGVLIPDKKGTILPNNRRAVTVEYY
jgi:hypothetical protein